MTFRISSLSFTERLSASFSQLRGLTLADVSVNSDDDEIVFTTTEGRRFGMWHHQDCCESVYVESIEGDTCDLIGAEILLAEEISNEEEGEHEHQTWTFYRLQTRFGMVVIRWCGSSNGYYSESVDFDELPRVSPRAAIRLSTDAVRRVRVPRRLGAARVGNPK